MNTWHASFWCALAERDVEVEFVTDGTLGFSRPSAVRSCSVFEPATAILCHRRCLDAEFRRSWQSPFPKRRHSDSVS